MEIVGRLLPVELEPTAKNERLADDMVRRREGGLFFFFLFPLTFLFFVVEIMFVKKFGIS